LTTTKGEHRIMSRDQEPAQPVLGPKEADIFARALYDGVAGPLSSFVLRLTRDPALAEEVVQEALVRAWRRADRIDLGPDNLRAWLFTVARNIVTDTWRAYATRPVIVSNEHALQTIPADDEIEQILQRWDLLDALNKLTSKHRDVLVEIYYQDSSIAEAARRLGVPPGTVKSRTYHALRALRLVLQDAKVA
jgi:RNA polymerase sigma-70 factor (ECF subfamily)